jgi:hypothetical protein
LGAPFAENDVEMVARRLDCGHRILRDDATIVFDFDLQVIVGQHPFAEVEDFCEPLRSQAMIGVETDMSLQQGGFVASDDASAIDKILRDMTYFGDVGVGRDEIAIRQDEAREVCGVSLKDNPQSGEFHGGIYILMQEYSQGRRRKSGR